MTRTSCAWQRPIDERHRSPRTDLHPSAHARWRCRARNSARRTGEDARRAAQLDRVGRLITFRLAPPSWPAQLKARPPARPRFLDSASGATSRAQRLALHHDLRALDRRGDRFRNQLWVQAHRRCEGGAELQCGPRDHASKWPRAGGRA
jgi:hypothetical protein